MWLVSDLQWRHLDFSSGAAAVSRLQSTMVAVSVLFVSVLAIITLPYCEPSRRVVRVRKKHPRVVVVQRNHLAVVPGVDGANIGHRVPPPVAHPGLAQPGFASTGYQPNPAYRPAPGPATIYQNPGYGPRLSSSGRRTGVPLPKCSYINTDFPGDDLYLDGATSAGLNAGSARACKARCRLEELCNFWTYREGDNRDTLTKDCFLKEGTPGVYC